MNTRIIMNLYTGDLYTSGDKRPSGGLYASFTISGYTAPALSDLTVKLVKTFSPDKYYWQLHWEQYHCSSQVEVPKTVISCEQDYVRLQTLRKLAGQ